MQQSTYPNPPQEGLKEQDLPPNQIFLQNQNLQQSYQSLQPSRQINDKDNLFDYQKLQKSQFLNPQQLKYQQNQQNINFLSNLQKQNSVNLNYSDPDTFANFNSNYNMVANNIPQSQQQQQSSNQQHTSAFKDNQKTSLQQRFSQNDNLLNNIKNSQAFSIQEKNLNLEEKYDIIQNLCKLPDMDDELNYSLPLINWEFIFSDFFNDKIYDLVFSNNLNISNSPLVAFLKALFTEFGKGTKSNKQQAFKLYVQGAERVNDPFCAFRLAEMYCDEQNYFNVQSNFEVAWYWLIKSSIFFQFIYGQPKLTEITDPKTQKKTEIIQNLQDKMNIFPQQYLNKIISFIDKDTTNSSRILQEYNTFYKERNSLYQMLFAFINEKNQILKQKKYQEIIQICQQGLQKQNGKQASFELLFCLYISTNSLVNDQYISEIYSIQLEHPVQIIETTNKAIQQSQICEILEKDNFMMQNFRMQFNEIFYLKKKWKGEIINQQNEIFQQIDKHFYQFYKIQYEQIKSGKIAKNEENLQTLRNYQEILIKGYGCEINSEEITKALQLEQTFEINDDTFLAEQNYIKGCYYLKQSISYQKQNMSKSRQKQILEHAEQMLTKSLSQFEIRKYKFEKDIKKKYVCNYYMGRIYYKLRNQNQKYLQFYQERFQEALKLYQDRIFLNPQTLKYEYLKTKIIKSQQFMKEQLQIKMQNQMADNFLKQIEDHPIFDLDNNVQNFNQEISQQQLQKGINKSSSNIQNKSENPQKLNQSLHTTDNNLLKHEQEHSQIQKQSLNQSRQQKQNNQQLTTLQPNFCQNQNKFNQSNIITLEGNDINDLQKQMMCIESKTLIQYYGYSMTQTQDNGNNYYLISEMKFQLDTVYNLCFSPPEIINLAQIIQKQEEAQKMNKKDELEKINNQLQKIDVWGFGVILLQIFFDLKINKDSHDQLWKRNQDEILENQLLNQKLDLVNQQKQIVNNTESLKKIWSLINQMIQIDNEKRINIQQVFQHLQNIII
ncbi:Protein kinase-like domain [Pseudocohnilembus persalinus]|uniref:Protein kinase-like domain n=1 Tax=Pseudocohnilembus persalinus TaxID=266149 RepID=A0A0V0R6L6_PSEPJ|nr:Protein kinase-like domain [Pseudocohnilembus persalinus]|eukprot:KRX09800.1 Protein kinase-like domain [Pseudocohnilembus persalinus]